MHLLKDENGNVIPHGDGPAMTMEGEGGRAAGAGAGLTNVRTNL